MFVFRSSNDSGYYVVRHVDTLHWEYSTDLTRATVFKDWGTLARWITDRTYEQYDSLPHYWEMVEVRMSVPQLEVVKVIG